MQPSARKLPTKRHAVRNRSAAVGWGDTPGRTQCRPLGIAPDACQAVVDDARLLGRDWGFQLADVKVPVRWWHGDADPLLPIAGVQAAISRLQDAELTMRSGESHLGGFAKIDEVLEFMRSQF